MPRIKLLPKNKIIKTSERDPANDYYLPLLGYFFRRKLDGVFSIFKPKASSKRFDSLCEIGYGGGILLPFLDLYTSNLYGIELHDKSKEVNQVLQSEGIKARLLVGNVMDLPIKKAVFDVIVCLSLLEHLSPQVINNILLQMETSLKTNGFLIIGFPGENILTRTLFTLFYNDNHKDIHIASPKVIMQALEKRFILKKTIHFPWIFGSRNSLYYTCLCEQKNRANLNE